MAMRAINSRVSLSPIEQAVLASCSEWRTLAELQTDLTVEFSPERVTSAVAFLKRRRLVVPWIDEDAGDRLTHELAYMVTPSGVLTLHNQRQAQDRAIRVNPPHYRHQNRRRGLRVV